MSRLSRFRMGFDAPETPPTPGSLQFTPNMRDRNHALSAQQIQNYAANKALLTQPTTDLRGAMMGYSETLG